MSRPNPYAGCGTELPDFTLGGWVVACDAHLSGKRYFGGMRVEFADGTVARVKVGRPGFSMARGYFIGERPIAARRLLAEVERRRRRWIRLQALERIIPLAFDAMAWLPERYFSPAPYGSDGWAFVDALDALAALPRCPK